MFVCLCNGTFLLQETKKQKMKDYLSFKTFLALVCTLGTNLVNNLKGLDSLPGKTSYLAALT